MWGKIADFAKKLLHLRKPSAAKCGGRATYIRRRLLRYVFDIPKLRNFPEQSRTQQR